MPGAEVPALPSLSAGNLISNRRLWNELFVRTISQTQSPSYWPASGTAFVSAGIARYAEKAQTINTRCASVSAARDATHSSGSVCAILGKVHPQINQINDIASQQLIVVLKLCRA